MSRSLTLGLLLTALSLPPIVQTARAMRFWDQGAEHYTERGLQELPFTFAGHTVSVRDTFPTSRPPSEQEVPGTVEVLLDDTLLFSHRPTQVRPGRDKSDLGRYHLWIAAWVFVDRAARDSVFMMGYRVGPLEGAATAYDLLTIQSNGLATVRRIGRHDRAESFPVYRTIQFLNDAAPSVYFLDLSQWWPTIFLPFSTRSALDLSASCSSSARPLGLSFAVRSAGLRPNPQMQPTGPAVLPRHIEGTHDKR